MRHIKTIYLSLLLLAGVTLGACTPSYATNSDTVKVVNGTILIKGSTYPSGVSLDATGLIALYQAPNIVIRNTAGQFTLKYSTLSVPAHTGPWNLVPILGKMGDTARSYLLSVIKDTSWQGHHHNANDSTAIKVGTGYYAGLTINTAGASSNVIYVYDGTAASHTTLIAKINGTASAGSNFSLSKPVKFTNGLYFKSSTGTAADVTISWRP